MIVGEIKKMKSVNETALEELQGGLISFYLTGSRAAGNAHEKSDWDFFAEKSDLARSYLAGCGFAEIRESTYYKDDLNVAHVYRKGDVHVQLVKDVEAKKFVEKYVHRYAYKLNKKDRKYLWKTAYDIWSAMK